MRALFDNGTRRGVAVALRGHTVEKARGRGSGHASERWLFDAAEAAGFAVFVTTDRNIPYQLNLSGRHIAVVALSSGRWLLIEQRLAEVAAAVVAAPRGGYIEVNIPAR